MRSPLATPLVTRGIVLAGGHGTRLHPITAATSKQLLPVYDKPMVYYPLSTLLAAGVREILVITTPTHLADMQRLLGDGRAWGAELTYLAQPEPRGIAEALVLGAPFLGECRCVLVLGDNVLHGAGQQLAEAVEVTTADAASIFAYRVTDPSAYGVIEFDAETGRGIAIEEKPASPRSPWAVPGLYVYGPGAHAVAATLTPSARGELEITDLHRHYIEAGTLKVRPLASGVTWFDSGTPDGLLEASVYVRAVQARRGRAIGCPEEAAWRGGLLDAEGLQAAAARLPEGTYRGYVEGVAARARQGLA